VSSPTTAARLLRQAPEILRRWERRVRSQVPAAKGQHRSVLREHLQQLLGEVARSLSPTIPPEDLTAGLTIAQSQGGSRALLAEYSLAAVFFEYRLLRQTILEVLDEGQLLPPSEKEAITDALERAMQDAGSQYALVQHAAERERGDEARAGYERERRITQVLQRPLLLKVAEDAFAGLSLATIYEPAADEAEVGGDFLDAFALPGGKVALVVADACGKGLEAAAHNIHVKDVLRAFLREDPLHPGPTLSRLNDVVYDTLLLDTLADQDTFIVLSLAVIAPVAGEAVFASAGAEPPLVLRASGKTEVVESHGLVLGVETNMLFTETPLHLEPGDTVLMVTDGITEARRGSELLGYEGMAQLAKQSVTPGSLYDAGKAILDGARDFAGGSLKDDACLILARRR
jgi:serine phosphatase RsbU (regulator of sigma subunit)